MIEVGGGGNILGGGTGADYFFFGTPSLTPDTVLDFNAAEGDKIALKATDFNFALDYSLVEGVNFFSGADPAAGSQTPTLLYDVDTHQLSYDADGTGGAHGAVVIATLTGVQTLHAYDILIA